MNLISKFILLTTYIFGSSCAVKGVMTDIPNTTEKAAVESYFFDSEPKPGITYDQYNKALTRSSTVIAEMSSDNIKLRLLTPALLKLKKHTHIIDEQKKLGKSQADIDIATNEETQKQLKLYTENKVCFDFNYIPKSKTGQLEGSKEKYWGVKIVAAGKEIPANLKINKSGLTMTKTTYSKSGYKSSSNEWSEYVGLICSEKSFDLSSGVSVEINPRFYENQTVLKLFEWSVKSAIENKK